MEQGDDEIRDFDAVHLRDADDVTMAPYLGHCVDIDLGNVLVVLLFIICIIGIVHVGKWCCRIYDHVVCRGWWHLRGRGRRLLKSLQL